MEKLLNILLLNKLKNGKGTTPTGTINITQNGTVDVTNYATADVAVPSVGGEKDVFFYDYDGTLVASYSKADFLALTEMPANPSHTGLVADGWNWTLSNAKTYVTSLNKLNIGQIYHTESGKAEFDFEVNSATGLSVTLNMSGNKNWGDGTVDTNTSHTYSSAGKYTVTCDGTSINNSGVLGQSDQSINYTCTAVRLTGITSVAVSAFNYCRSIQNIIISNSVTSLGNKVFWRNMSLKCAIIPTSLTSLPQYCFSENYSLEVISLPKETTSLNSYAFQYCTNIKTVTISDNIGTLGSSCFDGCSGIEELLFSKSGTLTLNTYTFRGCRNLKTISLPSAVTTLNANLFENCTALQTLNLPTTITRIDSSVFVGDYNLKVLDFSQYTVIPNNINLSAFTGINSLLKIIVPDSLYETWITTGNWSLVANNIVKASEA